ncbi:hypothetical protein SRABI128_04374 [Microbacterium sp. Bi128]|nr:hypothetical protein SRABI128_04374 [Microbacterium sp. Bi128]
MPAANCSKLPIFIGLNQSQLKAIAVPESPEAAWVSAMTTKMPRTRTWNPTMVYCTSLVACRPR